MHGLASPIKPESKLLMVLTKVKAPNDADAVKQLAPEGPTSRDSWERFDGPRQRVLKAVVREGTAAPAVHCR